MTTRFCQTLFKQLQAAPLHVLAPVVRRGLIPKLAKVGFDELFINKEYKCALDQLRAKAHEFKSGC